MQRDGVKSESCLLHVSTPCFVQQNTAEILLKFIQKSEQRMGSEKAFGSTNDPPLWENNFLDKI